MTLLLETTLRMSVLVGVALAVMVMLRRRSAAARHSVLAAAVCCAAVMPVLSVVAPAWNLGWLATPDGPTGTASAIVDPDSSIDRRSPVEPQPTALPRLHASRDSDSWPVALARVSTRAWLAGIAINLAILLAGLWQLSRHSSKAIPISSGAWAELTSDVAGHMRLRRPIRLLQSDHPSLLVTWGLFTPTIMLPAGAHHWSDERIRTVAAHELAHISRHDWLIQTGAELLRSVYWFNPLVWLACSRLRQQSEHACDDEVMNLGVAPCDYATHLLELARAFGKQPRIWFPAPAVVPRPSGLERRISAMLNDRLNHRPITRLARVATTLAVVGLTLPIAGFAQNTFATFSGTLVDPHDAFLPAARVILTDPQRQASHQVITDRNGRFELVGLAQGDYVLEIALPGFKTVHEKLTLSGQDISREIKLQIGSLQETISVTPGTGANPRAFQTATRRPLPPCGSAGLSQIGGNIRQPHKVRHVAPQHPDGKLEGIVRLETLIGTDGFVKDVRVVSSPHSALARAAVDAVKQWEFDETLLNCRPIEVEMSVTVQFSGQRP